jgi:hypothetical protein
LSKGEGPKFCAASIQNPNAMFLPGEALLDVMRSQNIGDIAFPIRFRDSDGDWYVTTCKLELEATMVGGTGNLRIAVRFLRQAPDPLKSR